MMQEKMTDDSVLTWGKFEGQKLANVPASYLLWVHRTFTHLRPDLKAYIEENMEDLKKEAVK